MAGSESSRARIGLTVVGTTIVLAIAGVSWAGASGASAQSPEDLLDCPEGSAYVVGDPPLYIEGVRTEESPTELAQHYAAEAGLATMVGSNRQQVIEHSSDRVDTAFRSADDRVVAVVSMENVNGWKMAGSIACASW